MLHRNMESNPMVHRTQAPAPRSPQRLPLPDQVALVLQGGGALGAYQGGVFEALVQAGIEINWIAGISIGAINAAVIAGNRPEDRTQRLRAFWEKLSSGWATPLLPNDAKPNEATHLLWAAFDAAIGVPGFFRPRAVPPFFAPPGTPAAISWYDSEPLAKTLDEFVDWDLLNNGPIRLSVGAVNIETGNFRYFDTTTETLDARHIMASGALPPGLPPIEIEGDWWWDGGLVSNTPLAHVLNNQTHDMLLFQVDLFPARGARPTSLSEVYSREKDIRYSSRTRLVTDYSLDARREHELVRRVLAKLPQELSADPDVEKLAQIVAQRAVNIVHLIYRKADWEDWVRDFEFSRTDMEVHWNAGRDAIAQSMRNNALLARNIASGRTAAFDLTNGKEMEE